MYRFYFKIGAVFCFFLVNSCANDGRGTMSSEKTDYILETRIDSVQNLLSKDISTVESLYSQAQKDLEARPNNFDTSFYRQSINDVRIRINNSFNHLTAQYKEGSLSSTEYEKIIKSIDIEMQDTREIHLRLKSKSVDLKVN